MSGVQFIHTQVKLGPGAGISYGTRDGGTEARGCLGGPARVKILSRARTPVFRLSPPYVLRFWPSASLTFTCSLTPMLLLWSLHEQQLFLWTVFLRTLLIHCNVSPHIKMRRKWSVFYYHIQFINNQKSTSALVAKWGSQASNRDEDLTWNAEFSVFCPLQNRWD